MMKRKAGEKAAALAFAVAVAVSTAACEKTEERGVSSDASPGSSAASTSVSAETPSPSPVAALASPSAGGDVSSAGGGIADAVDGVRVALRLCSPPTGFYKPTTVAAEPPFRADFSPQSALPELRGINAISVLLIGNEAGFSDEVGGSFALDRRGRVYAWGNRYDEWSYGGASYAKQVEGLPAVRAIAGEYALDAEGRVWFLNGKHAPYRVEDLTEPVKAIEAVGRDFVLALGRSGRLYAWKPAFDQFPKVFQELAGGVRAVFGGPYRAYWIDGQGDLKWLRDVSAIEGATPQKAERLEPPGGRKAERVFTTFLGDFVRTADGTVYAVSPADGSFVPTRLKRILRVVGTSAKAYALTADGTVFALSDDRTSLAQPVPGLTGVADIRAGWAHVLALKSDGTVWSWGSDVYGQLGRYPRFFERFARIGTTRDVQAVEFESGEVWLILRNGDVWKINRRLQVEPVLIGRGIVRVFPIKGAFLTSDGVLQLREADGECRQLVAEGGIREAVPDLNGWFIRTGQNVVLYAETGWGSYVLVKPVRFPEGRVPTVAKMFGYPVFTVLADDGSVYYRTGEEKDGAIVMERVADLPPVREWTTLDGTFFGGFCDVVRALGEDDRAYAVRVEIHFHENGRTPTYTMHARPYGANVRHLYGSLMERSDREVVETGMTVDGDMLMPVERGARVWIGSIEDGPIDAWYYYPSEGPSAYAHVRIDAAGTLYLYGYNPFFTTDEKPGPVRRMSSGGTNN
ncbi:MAG: hypothetical protein BLM47_09015 [Candidatus Reconcilbacillus cellulovorans]|mgnify:FL=1|uniref:Uncharacterized protein n=1 Tax=Candidatus Reconcilbacillus cellulovorans TaxID=1906605 RepID=A0A2A6DZ93_9BACL|nr:MAG: hypothetical protein BLM47_09015 [Candidatus Reconcilbacillus cellulovorans]